MTIVLMAVTSLVAQALILMFLAQAHSKELSTLEVGSVLAASGAGGAAGSFFFKILPSKVRKSWLPIQMVTWSVALFSLALHAHADGLSVFWSVLAMFVLGFTGAIGNIEFGTYILASVADDMIAKITGIGQMMAIGACAFGPVLGGFAVQRYGVKDAVHILLYIVLLLAFSSFFTPRARQLAAPP